MTLRVEPGFLPPASIIEQAEIRRAIEAWERATADARLADRELVRLERGSGRMQAAASDAQELAATIEQGKAAPKPKHVEAFEQQLADARRAGDATKIVAERRWRDIVEAFEQHGDELIRLVNDAFERSRTAYVQAVDAAEAAHGKVAELRGLKAFVADDTDARYRHGMAFLSVGEIPLPPLSVDSGALPVSSVFSLLKECGAPPPPVITNPAVARLDGGQTPPRHVPPGRQGVASAIAPSGGPATFRVPG